MHVLLQVFRSRDVGLAPLVANVRKTLATSVENEFPEATA